MKGAIYHIQRLAEFKAAMVQNIREGRYKGEGMLEEMIENVPITVAWDIARSMPYEQARPALIS